METNELIKSQLIHKESINDFFEYEGKQYPVGTMFRMTPPKASCHDREVIALFSGSEFYKDKWTISYNDAMDQASHAKYRNCTSWAKTVPVEKDKLPNMIIEILPGNFYVQRANRKRYVSDSKDISLVMGWITYLVVMGITSIFNGRIFGWIMWTIFFFVWRHNYKEKNCVYYE